MRNLSKTLLCAGFLACGLALSTAVPVTFQANMDYQISIGAFDPTLGTVQVRGPFTDWGNAGVALTNVPGSKIYQNTIDITNAVGTSVGYKFWHNGSGASDIWESGDNRTFTVTDTAQTLTRYFNDVFGGGPPIDVTFQVDMGPYIANNLFDPTTGIVETLGGFNNWSGGFYLDRVGTTTIWKGTTGITNVVPGATVYYKFRINGTDWEADPNRSFVMPTTATVLDPVNFNRSSYEPSVVTFQVDMTLAPGFDPATDIVEARGSFQTPQWSGGFTLTNQPGSMIYSGSSNVFHAVGTTEQFKFVQVKPDNSVVWESISNREFPLASGQQILPVAQWNNANPNDVVSVDTLVTFSVDMHSATTNNLFSRTIPFNPATMSVYLNGDFANWWNWVVPLPEYKMTETSPGSLIYTNTVLIKKGNLIALTYKYGVDTFAVDGNGNMDDEVGFGTNHVRYIRTIGGTTVLPTDTFGVMTVEPLVGAMTFTGPLNGQLTINWRGRPGVHLQQSANLTTWTDVPNTDAASTATVSTASGANFFRLIKP